jgi:hypothetical protein
MCPGYHDWGGGKGGGKKRDSIVATPMRAKAAGLELWKKQKKKIKTSALVSLWRFFVGVIVHAGAGQPTTGRGGWKAPDHCKKRGKCQEENRGKESCNQLTYRGKLPWATLLTGTRRNKCWSHTQAAPGWW